MLALLDFLVVLYGSGAIGAYVAWIIHFQPEGETSGLLAFAKAHVWAARLVGTRLRMALFRGDDYLG